MQKFLTLIIAAIALTSCSQKERIFQSNLPVEELVSRKIPINEILVPTDMLLLDDYFIIANDYIQGENCFFVYSAKDKEFYFSFGQLGQGPDDFIAPRLVKESRGNTLSIYDAAFGKLLKFDVTNQGAKKISEQKITTIKYPFQHISYASDSILLFSVLTRQNVSLYSYNTEQKSIVDTLSFETKIKERMGDKYNSMFDVFHFSNCGKKFVATFEYINQAVTGTIDEAGHFWGTDFQYPNIMLKDKATDNILYYLFPSATEDYFYTQYYGRLFKYMQPFPINTEGRSMDFLIEVYDWQKNIVRLLHPDSDILRFTVDKKTNKLYTWNPLKDFDGLLEYDLNK
ncbi:MAG: TolB-like 6-bladed beta-propeller domain-containing protein [Dysgonamonadaceae bacterium]|jgi:hypothetical protein|nr:TolB-like 6-bladed beta-propeller domain-containing protein [Dysgonamonadaceae bacterium]